MKIVKIITLSPKEIEEAVVAYYKLSNNTVITQLDKDGISITDYGAEELEAEIKNVDNKVKDVTLTKDIIRSNLEKWRL